MASSEVRGENPDRTGHPAVPPADVRSAEPIEAVAKDDRTPRRLTGSRVMGAAERERVLAEARDVGFPTSIRGYDRIAVDRYVERVTRLITELEMSSSPEAAIKRALDEVSEETRDILQRAHQTADDIAARSRSKADDRLQQAEHEAQTVVQAAQQEALEIREAAQREAQELRETAARETHQLRTVAQREADQMRVSARRESETMLERAEARARELARNAEMIWRERRRLIDDMRSVGEQLFSIGEVEGKRFPAPAEEPGLSAERPDPPDPSE